MEKISFGAKAEQQALTNLKNLHRQLSTVLVFGIDRNAYGFHHNKGTCQPVQKV